MRSIKTQRSARFTNLKLLLFIIFCTFLLIIYVSGRVYIIILEKKVNEIRKQYSEINMKIDELKIDVAELSKGSRIKKIAQEYLSMKMPEGAPEKLF